jgi:hypothetical protein
MPRPIPIRPLSDMTENTGNASPPGWSVVTDYLRERRGRMAEQLRFGVGSAQCVWPIPRIILYH